MVRNEEEIDECFRLAELYANDGNTDTAQGKLGRAHWLIRELRDSERKRALMAKWEQAKNRLVAQFAEACESYPGD